MSDTIQERLRRLGALIEFPGAQFAFDAADEIDRLSAELAEKDKRIKELMQIVMAVEMKHPGESRWETALRYVREAQKSRCDTAQREVSDE